MPEHRATDGSRRQPPSLEQVLVRTRCCLALALREVAENVARERGSPPEFMPRQIAGFVDSFELRKHFTESERALLDAPYGTVAMAGQVRLIAALDALHTLLWALGLIDDFGFGVPSDEERRADLEAAYPLTTEDPARAGLRSSAELWEDYTLGEALLWRIRLARAERRGQITAAERRDRVARFLEGVRALGGAPEIVAGDLALDGQPLAAFDEGGCNELYWVILARLATLLWVLGLEESWDRLHLYIRESEQRAGLEPPRLPEPPPKPAAHASRPDEREVATRVVALTTLFLRAGIEGHAHHGGGGELPQGFRDRLSQPEIAGALSPREAELIARAPGTWTPQEYLGASWRLEALGCLLWALCQVEEMPPYDMPFAPDLLAGLAQRPGDRTFRSNAELDRARQIAEMWHWRARTTRLMRLGRTPPAGVTYAKLLEVTAGAAHKAGDLPPPIEGDFPLFGKAYGALSEKELGIAASIALERHYAFNWLCGYAADWDHVPTDT
jgi:hypothetical protein